MKGGSWIAVGARRVARAALSALRSGRVTVLLGLSVLCLVIGEQFPFSDFPMYSSFSRRTSYVFLADGSGKPVATLPATGMTTATLRKVYGNEIEQDRPRLRTPRGRLTPEQKRPAGERTLAALRSSRWAQEHGDAFPPALQLYEVTISYGPNGFEKHTNLIAELR
jgi:hypothetical protein